MVPGYIYSIVTVLLLGLCGNFAASSHASLIAYDGFEITGDGSYTEGQSLHNASATTSTGLSGSWAMSGTQRAANIVDLRITADGLSGPIAGSGGAVESYRVGTGTATGIFQARRAFEGDPQITSSEQVYFSALLSFTAGHQVGVGVQFGSRSLFGVGFNSAGQAGIFHNPSGSSAGFVANTTTTYDPDKAYLVVGMMDASTGQGDSNNPNQITLVGVFEAGDPIVEGSLITADQNVYFSENDVPGNFSGQTLEFAGLIASKRSGEGLAAVMDEIRVGRSFASVIPEPTSLSLIGLAALGLLTRRRP